ncbi:MAG: dTDP-glucose 4,6-dehydratase [Bacteroidota bacterium]|jgi:dTDP-glucose 4,6-dehydratase
MSVQDENCRNFLITGGAGFIGLAFIHQLIRDFPNSRITVLDKLTYASQIIELQKLTSSNRIKFVKGDICDYQTVIESMKEIEIVINFAAESHVDRSIQNSLPFVTTNSLGVQVLLEAALALGVKTFLQVSTDEVYGSINLGSWNEHSPLKPNSPYAASKASGDLLALAFSHTHGLDVRVTRSSNNYGHGQNIEKLIPKIIYKILKREPIHIYGDGKNIREWIHVEDNCKAIITVLKYGSKGEIYNIGSGIEKTNNEIASLLIDISKSSTKPNIEFIEDRKGHDYRYSVDFSKIVKLGFKPEIELDSGLEKTFNWYKAFYNF